MAAVTTTFDSSDTRAGVPALERFSYDDAVVRNKAVCLALGVLADGSRDVLGFWIEQTAGAKF